MSYDFSDNVFVSAYDGCPFWSSQFGLTIMNKIDFKESAVVLDVGTGTGFPAIEIAERMGNEATVYAIDIWDAGLKRAETKAEELGIENIVFKNASVLSLPFDEEFFDLIISNNCLNNIPEYDKALRECYRVLKREGVLIQTFNLPDTFKEFYDIFRDLLLEKNMLREIEALNNHIFDKRKNTVFTLDAAEKTGFKIMNASEYSFLWRFYNGTSLLNHSFVKMAWLSEWQCIIDISLRETFFSDLEYKLNAYANENHGLSLTIPYSCVTIAK